MPKTNCQVCTKPTSNSVYCSNACQGEAWRKVYRIPCPEVTEYSGETKLINDKIIVDAELYDWLNQYTWHINDMGYAVRRTTIDGRKQTVRLHRLIMQPPDNMVIDHINRNPIDNRRVNLRICTQKENLQNTPNMDRAVNYYFDKTRKRWMVDIRLDGIRHCLVFDSRDDAAQYVQDLKVGKKPVRVITRRESLGGRKLTSEQIQEARELFAKGMTRVAIGAKFGVHGGTIGKIISGKTWRTN